eukprot:TRINITY_DN3715_c0_g1_i1.p1 TRINITY_DN3715_c0_g1~~TRINITY_DN3715_c0_g1_i1.p1  ORF type:complete len:419 (-),score=97.14 TRINITY_DN3715_c0_g1_i1:81-1337(-)
MCNQLVSLGVVTYPQLYERYMLLWEKTQLAFSEAVNEPKIKTREELLMRTSQPRKHINVPKDVKFLPALSPTPGSDETQQHVLHPMRKHMTQLYTEVLSQYPQAVYIGEDVTHGGYYVVTDGLTKKFPMRVTDFPPEETALMGVAIGYAQVGLLPIVEIPYAKYLDCGADMFFEACISNWLSNGKQPNGMIIRLQGFGKGVFGGNFHTHNSLYLPPGLDVVCYSNGPDYARGLRYSVQQALAGRVVMTVDCTNLLNLRHLYVEGDKGCLKPFTSVEEILSWDDVTHYGSPEDEFLILSYGNATISALRAQKILVEEHNLRVGVVDCPYLSDIPKGLLDILDHSSGRKIQRIVFVDECKMGQNPFGFFIQKLQEIGKLPSRWSSVAATPTYNPLGTSLTFVHERDIVREWISERFSQKN